jgi:hypothetical protein
MPKVAIYARVSTKDKGQSIDNQLPDLRRYAEAHGWDIYKEYAEEESGRPGAPAQGRGPVKLRHRQEYWGYEPLR